MMTTANYPWLRPSSLPKLALCNRYRPAEGDSKAAARGTAIDGTVRDEFQFEDEEEKDVEPEEEEMSEAQADAKEKLHAQMVTAALESETDPSPFDLDEEDLEAIKWTVDTTRLLAGGNHVESREEELRIEAMGLTGTADLLCEGSHWSADIKSGLIRNYVEQQALYALGFMERFFLDEWTVFLLYCDQEQIERHDFTLQKATDIVKTALAKVRDPAPASPNEYCGWCARRYICAERKESLGIIPFEGAQPLALESIPSNLLREFILRGLVIKDFSKRAREILKERLAKGEKLDGVSLSSRKGAEKIPPNIIGRYIAQLGTENVLGKMGSMSKKKFAEIWDRMMPGQPFPEEHVIVHPGSSFIRISRPKAIKE